VGQTVWGLGAPPQPQGWRFDGDAKDLSVESGVVGMSRLSVTHKPMGVWWWWPTHTHHGLCQDELWHSCPVWRTNWSEESLWGLHRPNQTPTAGWHLSHSCRLHHCRPACGGEDMCQGYVPSESQHEWDLGKFPDQLPLLRGEATGWPLVCHRSWLQ
jgi:hypothetical protein